MENFFKPLYKYLFETTQKQKISLEKLHAPIFEKILSYMSFEEIREKRLVCRAFEEACSSLLDIGFRNFERKYDECFRAIQCAIPASTIKQMQDPYITNFNIMEETSAMFFMYTYGYRKYIGKHVYRFISAKDLDNISQYMKQWNTSECPSLQFVQGFVDITTPILENFKTLIEPELKKIGYLLSDTNQSRDFDGEPHPREVGLLLMAREILHMLETSQLNYIPFNTWTLVEATHPEQSTVPQIEFAEMLDMINKYIAGNLQKKIQEGKDLEKEDDLEVVIHGCWKIPRATLHRNHQFLNNYTLEGQQRFFEIFNPCYEKLNRLCML